MKEQNTRGEIFSTRWKEKRTKKWKFAFIHGSIYWGLPLAIILFLRDSHLQVENMILSNFLTDILFFMIGGYLFGLYQFKKIDVKYMSLNDDEDIQKGIEKLKSGKFWNYENLLINKMDEKTLLVKNDLFWFKDSDISVDKINECFNLVMSDFQRLKKNLLFNEFSINFDVRLQIFDNSEKHIPLIDKII